MKESTSLNTDLNELIWFLLNTDLQWVNLISVEIG